jgi:enoyl-CoA hydratase/carnithine racemase
MTGMMLIGRKYNANEGLALGLTHYAVGEGEALELAQQLADKISCNVPLSNYVMIQSISRINDMSQSDGLFIESLIAAMSQTTPDAEEGLKANLEKRAPKFR